MFKLMVGAIIVLCERIRDAFAWLWHQLPFMLTREERIAEREREADALLREAER